ncbi:MAG TPA: hypothetical protein VHA82_14565 [Ramlibacter sp.]|uniref:hypothetical protein n=1 Tax=Ramlibacter sp. TaxID=1917967 RepID=UPI002C5CF0AC|nr:hypothetical protein [Ramlibacter sp.]HVZ45030.1 hypothetical protein [Ramlibacter sp.]
MRANESQLPGLTGSPADIVPAAADAPGMVPAGPGLADDTRRLASYLAGGSGAGISQAAAAMQAGQPAAGSIDGPVNDALGDALRQMQGSGTARGSIAGETRALLPDRPVMPSLSGAGNAPGGAAAGDSPAVAQAKGMGRAGNGDAATAGRPQANALEHDGDRHAAAGAAIGKAASAAPSSGAALSSSAPSSSSRTSSDLAGNTSPEEPRALIDAASAGGPASARGRGRSQEPGQTADRSGLLASFSGARGEAGTSPARTTPDAHAADAQAQAARSRAAADDASPFSPQSAIEPRTALTADQYDAHLRRRKALGLDGAATAKSDRHAAPAGGADRASASRDERIGSGDATALAAVAGAAAVTAAPVAGVSGQVGQVGQAARPDIAAVGSRDGVARAASGAAARNESGLPHGAQGPGQPGAAAPGELPPELRVQHEELAAQQVGAEMQAQAVQLAAANAPPESMPLEVLKAL